MTPQELQIKQNSCANCLRCVKPLMYTDPATWRCNADENKSTTLDPVSGDYFPIHNTCDDMRLNDVPCPWQKPDRIYYSDGSSKSVYQIEVEQNRVTAKISLRGVSVEDLI